MNECIILLIFATSSRKSERIYNRLLIYLYFKDKQNYLKIGTLIKNIFMGKSYSDLRGIALAGGSIVIDANLYSYNDLHGIALADKRSGGNLIIKSANSISYSDLRGIALANLGNVTFDFSE
jgi:hypothetical protein